MPEQTVVPRLHDIGTSFHITTVECKSRPGTVAGVNLHRYDSFRCEPQEATGVNSYQWDHGMHPWALGILTVKNGYWRVP